MDIKSESLDNFIEQNITIAERYKYICDYLRASFIDDRPFPYRSYTIFIGYKFT